MDNQLGINQVPGRSPSYGGRPYPWSSCPPSCRILSGVSASDVTNDNRRIGVNKACFCDRVSVKPCCSKNPHDRGVFALTLAPLIDGPPTRPARFPPQLSRILRTQPHLSRCRSCLCGAVSMSRTESGVTFLHELKPCRDRGCGSQKLEPS